MKRYTRVRLLPRSPVHFGGRGVGMEQSEVGLPADSLFSALCTVLGQRQGGDAVEALLARFPTKDAPARQPPFRLTSLMPWGGTTYLLPYPEIRNLNVPRADDLRTRKRFKAIDWVSEDIFRAIVGNRRPSQALDNQERPITLQGGSVWVTAAEYDALAEFTARNPATNSAESHVLWRGRNRPRVTVDRLSSASSVYAVGATRFNNNGGRRAGLYTTIEWFEDDADLRKGIARIFEEMGHVGIGGERSQGYGQFDLEWEELDDWSVDAPDGNYFTTLSPYHPRRSEGDVIGPGARYDIVLRRGWLSLPGYQNVRRSSVRMIGDGSVLRLPADTEPVGHLVDLTPSKVSKADGPVIQRYGLAFPVRVADAAMTESDRAENESPRIEQGREVEVVP